MSTYYEIRCEKHGVSFFDDMDLRGYNVGALQFVCDNRRRLANVLAVLSDANAADGFDFDLTVGGNGRHFPSDLLQHMDCILSVRSEYGDVESVHPPHP